MQWKLLLETKPPMADRQWSRDTEVEDMGFEKLDVSPLRNNIMYPIGESSQKQHYVPYFFDVTCKQHDRTTFRPILNGNGTCKRSLTVLFVFTCHLFHLTEDSASAFLPAKFDEFNLSVTLTPQYARGRHFVAAHDKTKNIYKVTRNTGSFRGKISGDIFFFRHRFENFHCVNSFEGQPSWKILSGAEIRVWNWCVFLMTNSFTFIKHSFLVTVK